MQVRYVLITLFLLVLSTVNSQNKYQFEGQSPDFPIYSSIDTSELIQFKDLFGFGNIDLDKFKELRSYLKPYLDKEDPLAIYIYAKSYDLGPYGISTDSTDSLALIYYNKLVEMNCANVELLLHSAYKYGDIGLEVDYKKSMKMLDRAILHGNSNTKAWGCFEYAHIYYNKSYQYNIEADTNKTIDYLAKTIYYDSTHHMAIDFLSGIYFDKSQELEKKQPELAQEYGKKSFALKMISPNEQSTLRAALWLIEGKFVEKDVERGVCIITKEAIKIKQHYPNVFEYMGSYNPVLMLNDLYREGKITWEQVKAFYIENYY